MSTEVRRALYGKMSGDSTLTNLLHSPPTGYSKSIYFEIAPEEAQTPYVIFQKQAGTPTYGFNSANPIVSEVWTIKAVDHNSTADTANSISSRLKTLLTDATLSISGATHLFLRYESDVDYSEIIDGERFIHSGSMFRLMFT